MDDTGYFVDQNGQTVKIPLSQAVQARQAGYLPATQPQIDDFEKVAKFSTTGQELKTFGEGAAQSLTGGLSSWLERGLGVKKEDIKAREEINPGLHLAGSLTGVAAPLVVSGGASLLGKGAAEAASLTAPSLIAKAGEGAAGLLEGAEATSTTGKVGLSVAKGALSAGTEGALYGAGHVVHEAALGDPNLTIQSAMEEIGLSGLLGGGVGAAGGLLSGLTGAALNSETGKRLGEWLENNEGNQALKQAGALKGGFRWLYKKMTPEDAAALGREGRDMGLGGPLMRPAATFDKSSELMDELGPQIDKELVTAGAHPDIKLPKAGDVFDGIRKDVVEPLEAPGADKAMASRLSKEIDDVEADLGGKEATLGLKQMNDARRAIDKRIYGYRGDLNVSNEFKNGLRGVSHGLGDAVTDGLESVPGDAAKTVLKLNLQYSVAATFNHISEIGMAGQAGNMPIPITAIAGTLAGLLHGGPLGGAAVGLGMLAAKRYGPGLLAAGSKALRDMVDEGGAEAVINKTADLISREREAETSAAAAAGATRLARAFKEVSERAEPLAAPVKDATRDSLQERAGRKIEGGATSDPETLAALSQLQAANDRVAKKTSSLAKALVKGAKSVGAAAAATAGTAEEMASQLENIHQLATNPDAAQRRLAEMTSGLHEHAPGVAQAAMLTGARAISHLHGKFPSPMKATPLSPIPKPSKMDLWRYNRTQEVINKPTRLLHHAVNGTMTPQQVEAVASVHPEMLKAMQQSVLSEMTDSGSKTPHRSRLMASMLFGQPMDSSMTPQAIAANQAIYQAPSAKPQAQATGKTTQTGLGKLKVSNRALLPGQAVESRRQGEA